MQIVWEPEAIERLKHSHTVLELEDIVQDDGKSITVYCVVPADKIGLDNFSRLDNYKELHAAFVRAYKEKNYKLCMDTAEHLMGQFGGEVDSFYVEILGRIKNETIT